MNQGIAVAGVVKEFDGATRALDDVSIDVAAGEFMVLVGPSGCGKSTLLRVIAGLEKPTAGTIRIDGHDVTRLPPRDRDIAMVFQSYALYPHMSVRENLAFGMRARRDHRADIARRVAEVAETLELTSMLDRRPDALSGGQRQRVAIGRAIVREPAAFLMDEPLSNLDAKLRITMRAELASLHERLGITTCYVTHDQVEAMTLGQRVAVLRDGRLQQVGTPEELFDRPANVFVAMFIGSPSMNLLLGTVADGALCVGDSRVPCPAAAADGPVIVGVRPTDLRLGGPDDPAQALLRVRADVAVVERLGTETVVVLSADGAYVPDVEPEARRLTAVLPGRCDVRAHETIDLVAAPAELYLFHPHTGDAA